MKAVYSKPELEVVTFTLSETIAACNLHVYNHAADSCDPNPEDPNLAFFLQEGGYNFGAGSDGCSIPLATYCYYTSSDATNAGITLFNS